MLLASPATYYIGIVTSRFDILLAARGVYQYCNDGIHGEGVFHLLSVRTFSLKALRNFPFTRNVVRYDGYALGQGKDSIVKDEKGL